MRFSHALIWAGMLIAVARTTILVRRRDVSDFGSVDGSATLGLVIVGFLGLMLVINPRTLRMLATFKQTSPGIFVTYMILAATSMIWSLNPVFTAFRAAEVLIFFLTAFLLMSYHHDFRKAERTMLRVLLVVTILSFLQRAINVGVSIQGLHTNVYTVTSGAGLVYCLGELFRSDRARKRLLIRWALVFFVFLAIGTSVGSNIAVLGGILMLLILRGGGRWVVLPLTGLLIALFGVAGELENLLQNSILAGRDIEAAYKLTGRNTLWAGYFEAFMERPVIGHGFAVGARLGDMFGVRVTTNTHNGLIEAALGMGTIGFVFLSAYLIKLLKELFFSWRLGVPGAVGMIGAMIMLIINNNSKSLIGGAFDATQVGIFVMLAFAHYMNYLPARMYQRARLTRSRVTDYLEPIKYHRKS